MTERITEAELARLEVAIRHDWSPGLPVPPESGWPLRLVAEVRRLRGLIALSNDCFCDNHFTDDEECGVQAMAAEAEAIRAEQGKPRS